MTHKVHWEADEQTTRCGLDINDHFSAKAAATREYVLKTTRTIALITCLRCRRSIDPDVIQEAPGS